VKSCLPFSCFLLILAGAIALACGSPSAPRNMSGLLELVTISPAVADAQNYPDGQVQFTATGYYSTPPFQVTPLLATWGACYQDAPTNGVSVSANGLARCVAGAAGTYTVWAWAPSNAAVCPTFVGLCGTGGCQVTGATLLTCP